ncbi:MAG: hypothetical protein QM770_23065 [Tepidisphaeraceae bacterium]
MSNTSACSAIGSASTVVATVRILFERRVGVDEEHAPGRDVAGVDAGVGQLLADGYAGRVGRAGGRADEHIDAVDHAPILSEKMREGTGLSRSALA